MAKTKIENELTAPERQEILAAIDSLLAPVAIGPGRYLAAPAIAVPGEFIASVVRRLAGPSPAPLTPEQLAEARKALADWTSATALAANYGKDRLKIAHRDHSKEVARAAIDGRECPVAGTVELAAQFRTRRDGLKSASLSASRKAAEVFLAVAGTLALRIREYAKNFAVEDFKNHVELGLNYEPSVLVKTTLASAQQLERLAADFVGQADGFGGTSPATMFAVIGITL